MIVIFCSHLVGKGKFELENIYGADLIFQLLTYFFFATLRAEVSLLRFVRCFSCIFRWNIGWEMGCLVKNTSLFFCPIPGHFDYPKLDKYMICYPPSKLKNIKQDQMHGPNLQTRLCLPSNSLVINLLRVKHRASLFFFYFFPFFLFIFKMFFF
jgi:hypothetical protein